MTNATRPHLALRIALVAALAALALAPLGPARAVPTEAEVALATITLCTDVSSQQCLVATARLKILGDSALPLLESKTEKLSTTAQLLILSALGTNPGRRSSALISKLAKNTKLDLAVRALALDELTRRGTHDLQAIALVAIKDKAPVLRMAAVRALATRVSGRDKAVIKALAAASQDTDATIRSEAAFGLGFCGCKEAGPVLDKALGDSVVEVRRAAVEGLAFVKHAPSVPNLIKRLSDKDDLTQRAAARALRFQTDESFGEDPQQWERWLASQR